MVAEALARGFGLLESPRWHDQRLYFSDWTAGQIHSMAPGGDAKIVFAHRSLPLCFDFHADGILVVSGTEHAVLLAEPSGSVERWADLAGIAPGGWNEIVVDRHGGAYVNCGNFDPSQGFPTSPAGFIVHIDAAGEVKTVATGLAFPNGMAISPDGRTLIVAESHAARLSCFGIQDDGALSLAETWAEVPGFAPDGICVDATGACWFADVPSRCVIRVTQGGKILDRIDFDRGAFSCCLADDATLYVTAAHWPGGQRMMDPTFDWDGTVYAIPAT